jgi:hypothetical protein
VRRIVAACAFLSTLALPGWAWSAEPTQSASPAWLAWDSAGRPEGCPSADELTARVEKLFGPSPAELALRAGQRIVLRVEREASNPGLWSAEATIVDAQRGVLGTRRIKKLADSCAPIADALALIVALSVSNTASGEAEAAPPPEPAKAPPLPALEQGPRSHEPRPGPAVVAGEPRTWTLAIEAGLAASAGMLPKPSAGAQGRVRIAPPAWPALYTTFTIWQQERRSLATGPTASLDLWTVGLGGCREMWSRRRLSFELCGGAETGRMRVTGFGIAPNVETETAGWFVDVAAGGMLEGRIARGLLAGFAMQLAVPLTRGRVVYHDRLNGNQSTDLWRMWPAFPLTCFYVGYAFR